MKIKYLILALIIGCLTPAFADIGLEFQISQNFTDNLLLDSAELKDKYTSTTAVFHYYPLSQVELNLNGEYTYYSKLVDLGNVMGGAGVTVIPTSKDSRITVFLSANYAARKYREYFEVYNTVDIDIMSSLSYRLFRATQLRAGVSSNRTEFVNSEEGDKESISVFTGLNTTLFSSNSLDIETGWSFADYTFIDYESIFGYPQRIEEVEGNLTSYYLSPRFSRPLGRRAGFSLTYTYSNFLGNEDPVVYSYSSGLLSPWASVFEGNSFTASLKWFPLRKLIVEAGYGFWHKRFLQTLDLPDRVSKRKDDLSRYLLSLSWPMPSHGSWYVEPSIQLKITNNTSSQKLYDYSDVAVNVGFLIRMQ